MRTTNPEHMCVCCVRRPGQIRRQAVDRLPGAQYHSLSVDPRLIGFVFLSIDIAAPRIRVPKEGPELPLPLLHTMVKPTPCGWLGWHLGSSLHARVEGFTHVPVGAPHAAVGMVINSKSCRFRPVGALARPLPHPTSNMSDTVLPGIPGYNADNLQP